MKRVGAKAVEARGVQRINQFVRSGKLPGIPASLLSEPREIPYAPVKYGP